VIKALNTIASSVIKWPDSERRQIIETQFQKMGHMKGVVGAVDGTYCPIKAPTEKPEVYINRKCFYGITLQAITNSELKFINCFVGYPSSVSDVRIFKNSPIYQKMQSSFLEFFDPGQYIIGDKAYPCVKFCIPPYIVRSNITSAERHFNTYLAKTRQVVERSFALLFGRFRRLRYLDMNRTDLIPHTIHAACVLHNLCLADEDFDSAFEGEDQSFMNSTAEGLVTTSALTEMPHNSSADAADIESAGIILRDEIRDYLPPIVHNDRRHRSRSNE
jgi:hypothetical protein